MKAERAHKTQAWKLTDGRCWYCGVQTWPSNGGGGAARRDTFTRDHIHPRSKGGGLIGRTNVVPACFACNAGKRDRTLEEFRDLMRDRIRGLKFGRGQIDYLRKHGFELPQIEFRFAFETHGWSI